MKIISSSVKVEDIIDGNQIIKNIERYGRTCYKSENMITELSSNQFVKKIIQNGHESVLEHEKVTVRIICDRGVSHEIVRHRIASYSQESTRYCNYSNERFGNELTFILPSFWRNETHCEELKAWKQAMADAELYYFKLLELGAKPEEARSVLPISLKTEIVVTMNLREWRHFFRMRACKTAHPQMQEIAFSILDEFIKLIPIVFDDICAFCV